MLQSVAVEVAGPLGTPLVCAMDEGLTSRGGRKPRLPLRFGLRPQGPFRVGTGESGLVLSGGMELCLPLELSGVFRPLVELCVCDSAEPRPRGCSGLGEPRPALPSL